MGTNFYVKGFTDTDSPETHIGKRSAAGLYCFDCHTTLCKDGESGLHTGRSAWHDSCPKCGNKFEGDSLSEGAVAVELGFAKPDTKEQRQGVRPCSSFTFAMQPGRLETVLEVEDEYGHCYTIHEFMDNVLNACPVKFYNSIGSEFS